MQIDRFIRPFEVIDLLSSKETFLRATEISEALNVPLSSTHNLLRKMVQANLLLETEGPRYSLGPRAIRTAIRVMSSIDVRTIAKPYMQSLARAVGEDVYLGIRAGDRIIYVDRVDSDQSISVKINLGQQLYLHSTAIGKLFAAYEKDLRELILISKKPKLTNKTITESKTLNNELENILAKGYSVSEQESVNGIVGFAVPIFDEKGVISAGIHVSALRAGLSDSRRNRILEKAKNAARAISSKLDGMKDRHSVQIDYGAAEVSTAGDES